MARTERHKIQNREAVAEMPEWMKDKHCPHKKKYMAGKRIQPKNLTGREKLSYLVDETFLAYNSARLKEACQLWLFEHYSADQGGVRGLDRFHRRKPLPRHAFCAQLSGAFRQFQARRY